ncbi:MAG: hypothetical protein R3230_00410 [Nitrosopumilaceae archaeon]|nr:hypothetical protein [Nitrosopumilaceae archaeon]
MSYSDIEREISKRFDDEVSPFVLKVYDAETLLHSMKSSTIGLIC